MPVSKTIPLHLLDDPEIAMRSEIDDNYLAELARDIAANGLINPVAVKQSGERYIVIAGHCRTIAKRRLGHADIDVRDYTGESINPETIKCRENLGRRDLTDYDIAVYLADLQEKNHYTSAELMDITGESEDWISKRLSLFAGDPKVFAALGQAKIKLGQALLLNRFPDEYRQQYLTITINSTPPVRVMEDWLRQVKQLVMNPVPPAAEQAAAPAGAAPGAAVIDGCEICGGTEMVWTMEFKRIHKHCWNMIKNAMDEQEQGG